MRIDREGGGERERERLGEDRYREKGETDVERRGRDRYREGGERENVERVRAVRGKRGVSHFEICSGLCVSDSEVIPTKNKFNVFGRWKVYFFP